MKVKTVLTNLCMITDGKNVVVQERTGENWPGISFPGGHVEPGESFDAAVKREVFEETGLALSHPRLVGIKDWMREDYRYIVLLYRADQFTGVLRSSEEGEVRWVEKDALRSLPLSAGMADTLAFYEKDAGSELYYFPSGDGWEFEIY